MFTTDAHALEAILRHVNDANNGSLFKRWSGALGARHNTPEFARLHSEVMNLFRATVGYIDSLPETSKRRYQPSIGQWWLLLTAPDHS